MIWGASLDRASKAVLLTGIGIGLLATILIICVPSIPPTIWFPIDIVEHGKTFGLGIEIVIRIAREITPSLSPALIAAAIVMGYAKNELVTTATNSTPRFQ